MSVLMHASDSETEELTYPIQYPVITAYEPLRNVRTGSYSGGYQDGDLSGGMTTTATNQAILRGKSKGKGKNEQQKPLLKRNKSSTSSHFSDRSGIVHLVVEDREAEDLERIRARKEGGPGWNSVNPKKFM